MRDLRQELFGAQDWVAELISNTKPEQYSLPTPCSEFTVKDLLDHYMCGVCDKIESFPVDRTPAETRTVDDYLKEWNASSQRARAVWTDEAMHRDYTMSWGACTVVLRPLAYTCSKWSVTATTLPTLRASPSKAQRLWRKPHSKQPSKSSQTIPVRRHLMTQKLVPPKMRVPLLH